MKNIALPFIFFGLTSTGVAAQDIFSIFDEPMSATMDIFIKNLDYQKKVNELEPQGSFSFERFKIVSEKTNIQLHNESHFYDAEIYRRDRLIGFQGPAASFAYKLNEDDYSYINSFHWVNIEEVGFFMDRSRIQLSGKNVALREPQYVLFANNLNLNCERHPDFILNNGDGFLSGCFNYGVATPLEGPGMGVDFKYYDEQGLTLVDFQGFAEKVDLTQEKVTTKISSVSANFSEKNLINATELNVECLKVPDLMKMNPETFIVPCLKDIDLTGDFMSLDFIQDGDKMTVVKPDIHHHDLKLSLDIEEMSFKTLDSDFKLTSSVLECNTPEDHDLLEVETFMKGCLNSSRLKRKNDDISFTYSIKEKEGEKPLDLDLVAGVETFNVSEEEINLTSNLIKLDVDDEVFLSMEDVSWNCHKDAGIDNFDMKGILKKCKEGLNLEVSDFLVKNFVNNERPILAGAKPEVVKNTNGLLHLKVPNLKLVDREDLTLMKNLTVLCKTDGNEDIFIPNEIIGACVKRGQIKLDKLFTNNSSFSPAQIMSGRVDISSVVIPEKDAKLFDINIITQDGIVYFDVNTKVLGLKSNIKFSGPISWDVDNEVITIKVENSRLPMGIKSENIFMFLLKKMLVTEMVTFEKSHIIKVSL